ncbi:STE protein kinase [Puccinia graminis f. sp. tritici CRL 75-36-700-3]|uniref:STE protein kinase n=1 Tax=Puccinia graminis f. sp. tritici (strain CRL 75-36-700-3 / race SCCL) TaxID=418459 RepID=E3KIM0_PUCGT|nr:STE protein kinase [Puccinia graminis f. sp. tritici CRL 75-36-700-3]EFP84145.2 STE protein kinase [Puccinia graminis f. sp. tritici CRL 75-36-700-3]
MSFGDRAQAAKEGMGMALRRLPQVVGLACPGVHVESYPPAQRLQSHSADCLNSSSYPSRYSRQLARAPALYYGCPAPRNQGSTEQSRVMVQHPTAVRYAQTTTNTPALVVPQRSHRKTVSTMDSTIIHRGPVAAAASEFEIAPAGSASEQDDRNSSHSQDMIYERPKNLRITTEFSPSSSELSHECLPQAIRILVTRNFDVCYFINLPRGISAPSIVNKIFARYDIPEQERSGWSIFRTRKFQPVGHALEPMHIFEECKQTTSDLLMFIILPSNPELMSTHLGGLLNSPECPPEYEETIPSASQVFSPEYPLSGLSAAPAPPVLPEIDGLVAEEPDPHPLVHPFDDVIQAPNDAPSPGNIGRRVSFRLHEDPTSIRRYPVTPPIRISELESSPGGHSSHGDQRASSSQQGPQWLHRHSPLFGSLHYEGSAHESTTESPFQYGGSLSPGHSQRPVSSLRSGSSSGRVSQPFCSRSSSSQRVLQTPQIELARENQNQSSSELECQDQCKPDFESDRSVSVENHHSTGVDHSIHSSPAPPESSSEKITTDDQKHLDDLSSEDVEEDESALSDGKESFSSCSSRYFPHHLPASDQVEDSNTSQTDQSDLAEPSLKKDLGWFVDLISQSFEPLTEDCAEIPSSLAKVVMTFPAGEQKASDPNLSSNSNHDPLLGNSNGITSQPSSSAHSELESDPGSEEFSPHYPINIEGNEKQDRNGSVRNPVPEDFEAESEDGPVSGDFQVPMETYQKPRTDDGMDDNRLPSYNRLSVEESSMKLPENQANISSGSNPQRSEEGVSKTRSEEKLFPDRGWATRPAVEKVCDNLEKSFPNHNIDQPIEIRILKHPETSHQSQQDSSFQGVKRVLSIRSSVSSRRKKRPDSTLTLLDPHPADHHLPDSSAESNQDQLYSSPQSSIKLWGFKTEEILPGSQADVVLDSSDQEGTSTSLKWVKGKMIGCGSFGMVYLALNLSNQAMMAVKQVKVGERSSNNRPLVKSALEAIKLEICFLKDLEHPNIVQYLGFEDTPEHCNIFLEYVEGGSIGSCIHNHGKLERGVVKSFTRQILEGLEYLHSCNIMHRDLKVDNVLVDMMGRCKISDFGISKRSNEAYLTSQYTPMQGTVFSMAPEVFTQRMACRYSAKADIWSLGCLVLEMLCGSRAWTGLTCLQIIYQVGIKRRTPEIPLELQTDKFQNHFLKKCLELEPCSRPTASRLIDHLFLELDPDWTFQKSELFKLL